MSKALEVTEATFEQEVLKSDQPVIVDFWATWCGPCAMLAPKLDEIAAEYEGKAKIVKVNIDDERALALKYNVMSSPTLISFKGGAGRGGRGGDEGGGAGAEGLESLR